MKIDDIREGYEDQTLVSKPYAIPDRHSTDTQWTRDTLQTLDGASTDNGWTLVKHWVEI